MMERVNDVNRSIFTSKTSIQSLYRKKAADLRIINYEKQGSAMFNIIIFSETYLNFCTRQTYNFLR